MRLLWAVLSVVLLGAAPVLANHFGPPFEYLNGTAFLSEGSCTDPYTRERQTCRVYEDTFAAIRYYVHYRGREVVRVLRVQDGQVRTLFGPSPAWEGRGR